MRMRHATTSRARARLAGVLLGVLLLAAGLGHSAEPKDPLDKAMQALLNWQMDDARTAARDLEEPFKGKINPKYTYFLAMLAYYEGNYEEARRIADTMPNGLAKQQAWKEFTDRLKTVCDLAGKFKEEESEHFVCRFMPRDEILAHDALDALERSRAAVGKDLGYLPTEKVVVEIYPDIKSFSTASTLKMEDIRKSGAIAICHFNRIMAATPRVFLSGYTWLDTLCHEYTHYVIVKKTDNAIPIWFHEGVAKTEERRWRSEPGADLEPLSASILSEGLKRNALVTFEEMHPTLAKLDHARAALAYAETRMAIRFLRERYGDGALVAVLDKSRETRDVRTAIAAVTQGSFEAFYDEWLAWLKAQKLPVVPGLKPMLPKTRQGVEEKDQDLGDEVNKTAKEFVRIGDLLAEEALWDAAVVEYEKAVDACDTISRYISNRVAYVLIAQKELDRAEELLLRVRKYYPEFQITHVNLGRTYAAWKRYEEAVRCFEDALRINPFDLAAREQLILALQKLDRKEQADEERARLKQAAQGLWQGTTPLPE